MKMIQTKRDRIVNSTTLIATVDLGKSVNTGYLRCPDGTDCKPFEFFNCGPGFNEFSSRISRFMKAHSLKDVIVGFESTGPYGEPLINYLEKRRIKLVQVNPMHTKKLKELQGNSPNKTDKKDPKVIADIIELGHALCVVVPKGVFAELRRLTSARERAIQRRTALLSQLHDLVFVLFPEFLGVMKGLKGRTCQYLLLNHPTPKAIVELGLESLTLAFKRISRGRLSEDRAQALYEGARGSVGVTEGKRAILFEMRGLQNFIKESDRLIAEIEEQMSNHLEGVAQAKFILSVKGIGKITAAGLIGEVGDFSKFRTASEILKLAGLDLYEISSGKHKGKRRISKRGRPLMRKLLFLAAINVVRRGGILHMDYQRYLERGMPKMKALVAIARKLLRIIFALVRDHSSYASCLTYTQMPVFAEVA